MYKYFGLLLIALLAAYVGYKYYSDERIDAREAVNRGILQVKKDKPTLTSDEEKLLRLQLAVVSFVSATGNPPSSLDELVPKYIDRVPDDPATGQRYAYERRGNSYSIGQEAISGQTPDENVIAQGRGGESERVAAKESFINPNTIVEDTFIYDPVGRRDPFLPFNVTAKDEKPSDIPPLERYKLSQLRLTAVIADLEGNLKGNVEDEQGKGYMVKPATKIGDSGGVVVKIEPDRLKILETQRDFAGNETSKVVEMVIQKKSK